MSAATEATMPEGGNAPGPGRGPATVFVEVFCAGLVLAEVLFLLSGVIARFVLHVPIIWIDELASTMFVWIAMLGSGLAMHRGQHMRLRILVDRLSPEGRIGAEAGSLTVCALVLLAILPSSIEYAVHELDVVTAALEWPGAVRSAAIPVGIVLMLAYALPAFARLPRGLAIRCGGIVAALGVVLALVLAPGLSALELTGYFSLVFYFIILLFGAVLAGVPIAFAFALATVSYLALGGHAPLMVVSSRMEEGVSSLIMLAVPLFVFLGALLEITGMARRIVELLIAMLGNLRGGLNYVLLMAMYLVSGISGSKAADMAAITPVLFPEMRRRGEDEGEMLALLAASGAMSETIPPSIVLITIGSVAGISISALFAAGLVPALLLAVILALVSRWRAGPVVAAKSAATRSVRITHLLAAALPALLLPFLIRAAVVEGVATATEVSTVGLVYVLLLGFVMERRIDLRQCYRALVDTSVISGMILLIMGAATAMSWALTVSGFASEVTAIMTAIPGGGIGFLLISIVLFIVLGSILEGIPAIVLFGPLLFPVAKANGIDTVHFSIVAVLAMGIGLFAPPFGVGYYTACAIGKVDPAAGIRAITPYLIALLVGTIAIALFPAVTIG